MKVTEVGLLYTKNEIKKNLAPDIDKHYPEGRKGNILSFQTRSPKALKMLLKYRLNMN